MHIVFIHDLPDTEMPGVSSIAGALRDAGHCVSVWIATEEHDPFGSLEELKPDVFAFSLLAGAQVGPIALGKCLKRRYPHIPTIIGGPNLISRPDLAEQDWVDFATSGEGEHLMVELLNMLEGARARTPRGRAVGPAPRAESHGTRE